MGFYGGFPHDFLFVDTVRLGPRRFAPRAARTVTAFPVLADHARAWRQKNKMAARLRPAKASALRREAAPIAEDISNSIARLRPMQDVSNSRGDGPAFGRFAGYAPETGRPRWKNQISPRPRRWTSRPAVSGSPVLPWNWPSCRSVPAPGTQRNWHRAIATVPGGCDAVTDPAKF